MTLGWTIPFLRGRSPSALFGKSHSAFANSCLPEEDPGAGGAVTVALVVELVVVLLDDVGLAEWEGTGEELTAKAAPVNKKKKKKQQQKQRKER